MGISLGCGWSWSYRARSRASSARRWSGEGLISVMCHRSFGYIVAIAQGPDGAGETLPHGRGGNSEQLADLGAGEGVAVAEGEKLPNLRRKFFVPLARRLHLLAAEQVRERSPRVHELGRCL